MRKPRTLAERLKYARKLRDFDQEGLARAAEVSQSIVSAIEVSKRTNPTIDTLSRLARPLGCSIDWLVSGTGEGPHQPEA